MVKQLETRLKRIENKNMWSPKDNLEDLPLIL